MVSIAFNLGCMLTGVYLNIFLYGMSVVQGYMYFINFKNDKLFMKVFVAVLLVADTLNTFLDCGFMFEYLVINFGDVAYSARANEMFNSDPVLTSVIALSCQSFFAWRVYRLMHSWTVPVIIIITGFVSFLGAVGTTIGVDIVKDFSRFQSFQVVVIIWLAFAALTDLIITVALVWTLQKSRTGFAPTDDVITRLIRVTLQTGMATSVFAILDLITFVASETTLHLVFNLPLAKLYVNSLLSTLNARALMANHLNRRATQPDVSSGAVGSKDMLSGGHHVLRSGPGPRQMRFSPSRSGEEVPASPSRSKSFFSSLTGASDNAIARGGLNFDQGIQVTTIEERYEEPPASTEMASYPHRPHQPRAFPGRQESFIAADPEYYSADLAKDDSSSQKYLRQTPP